MLYTNTRLFCKTCCGGICVFGGYGCFFCVFFIAKEWKSSELTCISSLIGSLGG